jgi:hypothetical protein
VQLHGLWHPGHTALLNHTITCTSHVLCPPPAPHCLTPAATRALASAPSWPTLTINIVAYHITTCTSRSFAALLTDVSHICYPTPAATRALASAPSWPTSPSTALIVAADAPLTPFPAC